ncbi:hypothetical protein GCM10007209_11340 [Haloferax sulfurifontis]|uniref:Uncharacterized protein n=1 Tax=Haloferax sulfurifontis TaxID=255616 RepID=A0A830E556_9EURY|nr:hypothetical protein GCM10007209_11340 [Haloferax sulfurifontis]
MAKKLSIIASDANRPVGTIPHPPRNMRTPRRTEIGNKATPYHHGDGVRAEGWDGSWTVEDMTPATRPMC